MTVSIQTITDQYLKSRFNQIKTPKLVNIDASKVTHQLQTTAIPTEYGVLSVGVITYDKVDTDEQMEQANFIRLASLNGQFFEF
jgi:hypothetical protein